MYDTNEAAVIGRNIRKYREAAGMSQVALAKKIGKTSSAVSQYEAGDIAPRLPVMNAIADALGVTRYDLLRGTYEERYEYASIRIDVTQDEEELIGVFRSMPADKREQLMRIARSL